MLPIVQPNYFNSGKPTDDELYQKFHYFGQLSLKARNKCIGLLPEIFKRKIYQRKGYLSIYEFAAKLAGLSQEQVNRVLNLEKRLIDKPLLHQALVRGEVGMNKLRKAVVIATFENQQEVLESVKNLSLRAVETMVRDFKNISGEGGPGTRQNTMFSRSAQLIRMEDEGIYLDETVRAELVQMQKKGLDINHLLKKFLKNYREEVTEEQKRVAEEVIDKDSRYVPVAVRRVLRKEFGQHCSVPKCEREFKEIHHLLPYAIARRHDPRLMVQLCSEHHRITHLLNIKVKTYQRN